MIRNLQIAPLVLCLLAGGVANAQLSTGEKTKLDSFFNVLDQNNKFMGSVAMSQDGKVIYEKSVGFADVARADKAHAYTKYRIGSISKTFTAVLVMKAVEEKKLGLRNALSIYFPEIQNAQRINISDLLYHRSGIGNFTDSPDYMQWHGQAQTQKQLLQHIVAAGSEFEPDSKASYSNSNYVLLSIILERIYEKPFAKLLEEKIVRPLGLQNTYFGGKIDHSKNEAYSYSWEGGKWALEAETDMSVPLGAGAVVSTPTDLTKFATALFEGKLLSKASLEQMETTKEQYGMGLFKVPYYEKWGYGHTGGIDGFSSMLTYMPQEKLACALVSNGSDYSNNDIVLAMLSSFYQKPYDVPSFKIVKLDEKQLEAYLGTYASEQIPLKLTITKENGQLVAQATGQSSFPLDAVGNDVFRFDKANIEISFEVKSKQMRLKQSGVDFLFTKE